MSGRIELAVVRQRYTAYGGAERFLAAALEALAREGVALTLYTRSWPEGGGLFEPVVCDPFHLGSLWRDASFAACVRGEIRRRRPALVQTHERIAGLDVFRAGDGVHAVWLQERSRGMGPLGRLRLRANPYHRYVLAAEARLFRHPGLRAVICNSAMVREEILARFPVAPERLHVLYNAVDARRFNPSLCVHRVAVRRQLGLPGDATVFLLVGSGYERKGVATAIEALARLPPAACLVVVGREKRQSRYEALARRVGVADRCRFAGPQEDTAPLYGAADAFVLPSLYDPCPNAALEALACGLPVVTSTKCGAAELALGAGAGLACESGDARALAGLMRQLLDGDARRAMGARAPAAVAALTPETLTGKLLALYRSLLYPGSGKGEGGGDSGLDRASRPDRPKAVPASGL